MGVASGRSRSAARWRARAGTASLDSPGCSVSAKRGGLSDALKLFSRDPKTAAQIAADPQWSKFMEGGAFPMKISRIENGVARTIMEVTSVERRKIDDSLFNVPSDYREMKMPKLPPAGPK